MDQRHFSKGKLGNVLTVLEENENLTYQSLGDAINLVLFSTECLSLKKTEGLK